MRDVTKVPQERQHGGAALIQHRLALMHNHADKPSLTLLGLSRSPRNKSIKPPREDTEGFKPKGRSETKREG